MYLTRIVQVHTTNNKSAKRALEKQSFEKPTLFLAPLPQVSSFPSSTSLRLFSSSLSYLVSQGNFIYSRFSTTHHACSENQQNGVYVLVYAIATSISTATQIGVLTIVYIVCWMLLI